MPDYAQWQTVMSSMQFYASQPAITGFEAVTRAALARTQRVAMGGGIRFDLRIAIVPACGVKAVIHARSNFVPPDGMTPEPDFNASLEHVDILSLHCPLTDKTRGMIGAPQFPEPGIVQERIVDG